MAGRVATGIASLIVAASLCACGGASPTPQVSTHSARAGEPALVQVDGYQYVDPTSAQLKAEQLQNLTKMKDAFPEAFSGTSTHLVQGAGNSTIWIVEIGLGSALQDTAMQQQMVAGVAKEGMSRNDPPMTLETLSGESVAVGEATDQGKVKYAFVWIHANVLTTVLAEDEGTGRAYVTTYLSKANSG